MAFPEHRLVLKPNEHWRNGDVVHKGISGHDQLNALGRKLLDAYGSLWAETDLRAMANPTRMKVIADAAAQFAAELARTCPNCGLFHFAITQALWGLPCGQCGFPTKSTRAYLRECRECAHRVEDPRPDGRTMEDPQYCDLCNP